MPKPSQKQPSLAPDAPEDTAPLPLVASPNPKLVVPLGRGSRGKTFWTRWAVGRAQMAGRDIIIADADRTNPTLSGFFGEKVITPPNADDADMIDWVRTLCEEQLIEQRRTAILDLGGGDLLLKRIKRNQLSIVDLLERMGVQVVAVHLLGPDREDLAFLRDLEANKTFAPNATVLVINEALVLAGRSTDSAFGPVFEHPDFEAVRDRGAQPIWMPRLIPANEVDNLRLTFAAAEAGEFKEGQKPIGPWNRQVITEWLAKMEHNFDDVKQWLP